MNPTQDTIAAIATPPGRGGVGIVRVSGPAVRAIAEAVVGRCPAPRRAAFATFRDGAGEAVDEGLALFFPGPHSFTGEDVLELQGHGGPVVLDLLVAAVLAAGARAARPGEFSERAFLNDKLDLAQAEAVADLIDAGSAQAARASLQSLRGRFSTEVDGLVEALIELRIYVEAALDFPEEEVDFLGDAEITRRLEGIEAALATIRDSARQGCLLREGMTVVLAGQPNAGKSSLLNRLAGRESAIVTEIPGTTRDILREEIGIDGLPVHVIDTAGLRDSADPVEAEGIRRAWDEIENADRIVLICDDRSGIGAEEEAIIARLPDGPGLTVVRNKIDLSGNPAGVRETDRGTEVRLSARDGEGVEALVEHLKATMGYQAAGEGTFMARRRHLDAIERADAAVGRARTVLEAQQAGELMAEELRTAQSALSEITGEFTSDDLLGRIFSSFCIGK